MVRSATVFNAALIKQKLGLSVQEITRDLAERLGLSTDEGLVVAGVDRTGPGAEAGFQRGTVILALDGQSPENLVEAAKVLHGKKKGDAVTLEVLAQRRRGMLLGWEHAEIALRVQ
jgi:S1-C subfamily serine protease